MKSFRILAISASLAILCAFALTSEAAGSSLKADFSYATQEKTVRFADRSIGLNIETWFWDFGDRNTSSLRDPVHAYAGFGIYKVVLEVVTSTGNISFKTQNVTLSRSNATETPLSAGEIFGLALMASGFVAMALMRSASTRIFMAVLGLLGFLILLVTVSLGS